MSAKITGYAMSPEEIAWLHDLFMTVQGDFTQAALLQRGGGGKAQAYFGDTMNKHFWCL